jgi:hypothetical protein
MSHAPNATVGAPEKHPKAVVKYIGREYVERDSLYGEGSEWVARAYTGIESKVRTLVERIPVPVVYQEADPYDDYQDMAETVAREQKLRVYNQHTDHPHFSHRGQLAFRAVHDWYGHLSADVDFSPEGEYLKWEHMARHFGPEQNRVMFAEVVGQVAQVHYLSGGFESDRYEQRAFAAPSRWMQLMQRAVES